jgi:hypothetical protein
MSLEYCVAHVGQIKAFLTNFAASVWPDTLRLFINNLYLAVYHFHVPIGLPQFLDTKKRR